MKIHTFIFNWRGQYDKTKQKEQQLKDLNIPFTVINSDEEHEEDGWENIGEESYFTAQFLKAVEIFSKTDADALFHIQADASFDNWGGLIYDAEKYFEEYNIADKRGNRLLADMSRKYLNVNPKDGIRIFKEAYDEYHGASTKCARCGKQIPGYGGSGRLRKYCSDKCKQRDYRARLSKNTKVNQVSGVTK